MAEAIATCPSLRGRTVLVTGGGSGIGAAITRRFAEQGARVGFLDIAAEPSRALASVSLTYSSWLMSATA